MKVKILTQCELCEGKAHLPVGEAETWNGEKYTRYEPCLMCQGSGNQAKWIPLEELVTAIQAVAAPLAVGPHAVMNAINAHTA